MSVAVDMGHNCFAALDLIAHDARHGLALVKQGEDLAIEGWLIYGTALNEGRAKFPSDEQFGEWIVRCNLQHTSGDERNLRAAAMWAAANPRQFAEMREAHQKVRTVRGWHDKWKAKEADEKARAAEARAEVLRLERAKELAAKLAADKESNDGDRLDPPTAPKKPKKKKTAPAATEEPTDEEVIADSLRKMERHQEIFCSWPLWGVGQGDVLLDEVVRVWWDGLSEEERQTIEVGVFAALKFIKGEKHGRDIGKV